MLHHCTLYHSLGAVEAPADPRYCSFDLFSHLLSVPFLLHIFLEGLLDLLVRLKVQLNLRKRLASLFRGSGHAVLRHRHTDDAGPNGLDGLDASPERLPLHLFIIAIYGMATSLRLGVRKVAHLELL